MLKGKTGLRNFGSTYEGAPSTKQGSKIIDHIETCGISQDHITQFFQYGLGLGFNLDHRAMHMISLTHLRLAKWRQATAPSQPSKHLKLGETAALHC